MTSHQSRRILYLEDNEDMRYYVPHMLRAADYEVTLAGNLVDGLRLAKIGGYDLYLFDYHLPDGAGHEEDLTVLCGDRPIYMSII